MGFGTRNKRKDVSARPSTRPSALRLSPAWQAACSQKQEVSGGEVTADTERDEMPCA